MNAHKMMKSVSWIRPILCNRWTDKIGTERSTVMRSHLLRIVDLTANKLACKCSRPPPIKDFQNQMHSCNWSTSLWDKNPTDKIIGTKNPSIIIGATVKTSRRWATTLIYFRWVHTASVCRGLKNLAPALDFFSSFKETRPTPPTRAIVRSSVTWPSRRICQTSWISQGRLTIAYIRAPKLVKNWRTTGVISPNRSPRKRRAGAATSPNSSTTARLPIISWAVALNATWQTCYLTG